MTEVVGPGHAMPVTFTANGVERRVEVEPRTLLSDTLRHEIGLTGTHVGCEQGACGACTVLIDGTAVRSCLMLAPQVEGRSVETIESVDSAGAYHAVQAALHERHGLQCGFCTPGIVMSLVGAHRAGASLDEAIDEVLEGHLCRCTGYVNIRAAVRDAFVHAGDR